MSHEEPLCCPSHLRAHKLRFLLDEQRMAMLVVSLVRLGDFDSAAEPLAALTESPRSSKSVWAAEYSDRISIAVRTNRYTLVPPKYALKYKRYREQQ